MSINTNEALTVLAEIIHEVAGTPVDKITPEAGFTTDLDLDSLTMVEVVVAAEQKFDVRIPDGDVAGLITVADAITFIQSAAAKAGQPA